MTPLCSAAEKGDTKVVELLLDRKANIEHANEDGIYTIYADRQSEIIDGHA